MIRVTVRLHDSNTLDVKEYADEKDFLHRVVYGGYIEDRTDEKDFGRNVVYGGYIEDRDYSVDESKTYQFYNMDYLFKLITNNGFHYGDIVSVEYE